MNIGAESAIYMEKSLTICHCQVDKLDCPNISNINHVNKGVVLSWQKIIRCGSQLIEIDTNIDIDYDHNKSNLSGYLDFSTGILNPIIGKIKMLEEYLTEIEFSYLGNNLQTIILCDII